VATLSRRQLGRATLARQLLLERSALSPVEAVARLAGLQAQAPLAPYVALWSRLTSFDPTTLSTAIERHEVVRTHVMRTTIHLVTAADALAFRGAFRARHESDFRSGSFAKALQGLDLDEVTAAGQDLLADRALSRGQLSAALAEQFPGYDPTSMAYAVTYRLACSSRPPEGSGGNEARPPGSRWKRCWARRSTRHRASTAWCSATSGHSVRPVSQTPSCGQG
jgi:Winged helix DNA-binding domain